VSGKTAESVLRKIPAVGELVSREYVEEALIRHPRPVVIFALRNTVEGLRNRIIQGTSVPAEELEERIREDFEQELETLVQYNLRKVINATGVIIHTNLGRSILAEEAVAKIQ